MKTIRLSALLALLFFVCVLAGCSETARLGKGDFFNMRKISLTDFDKEYLLQAARAMQEGRSFEKKTEEHPILFKTDQRGVFIILPRTNEHALCVFGLGEGIYGALLNAAKKMKRMAANEDLSRLKIRLDLIDESTDIKTYTVGKKWNTKFRTTQGLIFDTEPVAALLPDEIVLRNVIDYKGRFNRSRMRQVIKDRGIGTKVLDAIEDNQTLNYNRFTRISFMETDEGPLTLLNGRRPSFALDTDTLLSSARRAGEYLKKIVHPDGRFDYIYYPQMNRPSDSYNLLRHAGTCYAMTELYEVTADDQLLEKVKLAHKFLLDRMEGPTEADAAKGVRFRALFHKEKKEAKAGGAALCVIAFAKYTAVTGDRQYLPLMQDLARFIQHQTEPNGHLISKYYKKTNANNETFDSIYYPGECVLALTRLNQLDGDPSWIKTASKLVDFMVYERDKELAVANLPHDHWLCIGINELYPIVKKDDYKAHVYKIGDSIYDMMRKNGSRTDWIGSFYSPPRSTPSATRNEACVALYFLSASVGDPTDRWYEASQKIGGFQLRMQLDSLSGMFLKHPDKADGGFMRGYYNPEIRIDYVQHNISSLLGLWRIQLEKQGGNVDDFLKGKKKHQEEKPAA